MLQGIGIQAKPPEKLGRFRWLIAPERRQFPLPASGLWILALDWLMFSTNEEMVLGLATPFIGFLLGGGGTFYFQSRFAADSFWKAGFKRWWLGSRSACLGR